MSPAQKAREAINELAEAESLAKVRHREDMETILGWISQYPQNPASATARIRRLAEHVIGTLPKHAKESA